MTQTNIDFLRICWQLGDWLTLSEIGAGQIDKIEGKGEAAAYMAAAYFQLGDASSAMRYRDFAEQWGVSRSLLARVLTSGAYNNLALASTLATPDSLTEAKSFFDKAAEHTTPGLLSPSLVKARTDNQLEHLRQQDPELDLEAAQRLLRPATPGASFDLSRAVTETINQQYVRDEADTIWVRAGHRDFSYSDGDSIEERILSALRNCKDVSVLSHELVTHQIDWPSEYHLSADRANLLRPFAQKLKSSNVLELGCGCGAITRFLGEEAHSVVAVEGSPQRAVIAAERCRDLDNVTVISDRLQDVPFSSHFDVVTLIGVLEYSQIYVDEVDPIQHVLQKALSCLKDDGILILAIENQLGLKYFAGASEDHGVGKMTGINDLYTDKSAITFGRQELQGRIIESGFSDVQTFLPFPDYKLPCLVVHPKGYADEPDWGLGDLLATTVYWDRQGVGEPFFSLESALPLIARNGLTADLANSHLFIASKEATLDIEAPATLANYYSPARAASTRQELVFLSDEGEVSVSRRLFSDAEIEPEVTLERHIKGRLHSQLLHKVLQNPGWQTADVKAWAQVWIDTLSKELISPASIPTEWPLYDKYLPANYLDAIPRNLIVAEDGFHQFIDLEWPQTDPLPFPLVLYRGLLITLSTVTSISRPSDPEMISRDKLLNTLMEYCGYVLTDEDYEVFIPLLNKVSEQARGMAPQTFSSKQAIKLGSFKVRQASQAHNSKEVLTTLYWGTKEKDFHEDNTVKVLSNAEGQQLQILLQLSKHNRDTISKVRLDIADRRGCFVVSKLECLDHKERSIWAWDCDFSSFSNVSQMAFFQPVSSHQEVCMLSTGSDPQFELSLPKKVLKGLSNGGGVLVELRAFV